MKEFVKTLLVIFVITAKIQAQEFAGFKGANSSGWQTSGTSVSLKNNNSTEVFLNAGISHTVIEDALSSYNIVNVAAGTYSLGADTFVVRGKKNFIIRGAGPEKTIFSTTGNSAFFIQNCDSFIVENITIKGGSNVAGAFNNCKYAVLRNCVIRNGGGFGVSNGSSDVWFIDNWMLNNTAHANSHGIEVNNSTRVVISRNRPKGNYGKGIELWDGARYCTISNNITESNSAAITINEARYNTVTGNVSIGDTVGIILSGNAAFNTISNNIIRNRHLTGSQNAFSFTSVDSNIITFNIIDSENEFTGTATGNVLGNTDYLTYRRGDGWQSNSSVIVQATSDLGLHLDGIAVWRGAADSVGSGNAFGMFNSSGGETNIIAAYTAGGNGQLNLGISDGTTRVSPVILNPSGEIVIGNTSVINNGTISGGANSFASNAELDTVVVSGATNTDLYTITLTSAPTTTVIGFWVEARTGEFVVHLEGTSVGSQSYTWKREKL